VGAAAEIYGCAWALVEEFDYVLWVEGSGKKISAMPDFFRAAMSGPGMMPPTRTVTSSSAFFSGGVSSVCGKRVVGAGEEGESRWYRLTSSWDGRGASHLRRLADAGVDHFHAGRRGVRGR